MESAPLFFACFVSLIFRFIFFCGNNIEDSIPVPQAVVQYMSDLVTQKEVKTQTVKQKKSWAQICFFSRSNKRKRNSGDYAKSLNV